MGGGAIDISFDWKLCKNQLKEKLRISLEYLMIVFLGGEKKENGACQKFKKLTSFKWGTF